LIGRRIYRTQVVFPSMSVSQRCAKSDENRLKLQPSWRIRGAFLPAEQFCAGNNTALELTDRDLYMNSLWTNRDGQRPQHPMRSAV